MQAIILAAGMGKRLKQLTKSNTKCMVDVNGIKLIQRMLYQLDELNLSRIIIVVGYKAENLCDFISTLNVTTELIIIHNPKFSKTNNIYSLSLAQDYLVSDDTILLESDLILDDIILQRVVSDPRSSLAVVDKYESWMDGTCLDIDDSDNIVAFIPSSQFDFRKKDVVFKTVNVYKFSKKFSNDCYVPFLNAYLKVLGQNEYYEQVLRVISLAGNHDLKAMRLNGECWYEIDDLQDLDIASSIFSRDEDRYYKMNKRHGGFWRYPKMNDFCYRVNPGYPPPRMISEIKANIEVLMTKYPSSLEVNNLLAAKMFDLEQSHVVVGNGISELMKAIVENIDEKIGLVMPSSYEFPNNVLPKQFEYMEIEDECLKYTVDDLIAFIKDKQLRVLMLMNPDNISGNFLCKLDLLKLLTFAKSKSVIVIIDESAIDYVDEKDQSFLSDEMLFRFENLIIIKSISESHGISGVRLGVLATSNQQFINTVGMSFPLWNINSLSEFYLQIMEKYKVDYDKSIENVKKERRHLSEQLKQIQHITVLPSQSNHITVLVQDGLNASYISQRLLIDYNIYVKDLNVVVKQDKYLRFSIKTREDNQILVDALKKIVASLNNKGCSTGNAS